MASGLREFGRKFEREFIRPLAHLLNISLRRRIAARNRNALRPTASLVEKLAPIFPPGERRILKSRSFWAFAETCFVEQFYRLQFDDRLKDVETSPFLHFLNSGIFEGYRPTIFFNEAYYRERLERMMRPPDTQEDLLGRPPRGSTQIQPIEPGVSAFAHFLTVGRRHRIVPTPLYDEDYYLRENRKQKLEFKYERWGFEHFLRTGSREGKRSSPFIDIPAPVFATSGVNAVDFTIETEAASRSDFRLTSRLERAALHVESRLKRLESPELSALISRAAEIEPLVAKPLRRRDLTLPPIKGPASNVVPRAAAIRAALGLNHADTIVLIPHCRMAGSARVAGQFVQAAASLAPDETVLVLTTDLDDFEHPEWFGSGAKLFRFSTFVRGLEGAGRIALLLDVIRGLAPKRVVNINSALAWQLYTTYARQLSRWTSLFAYLFTFDRSPEGNKVGYPVSGYEPCAAYLTGTFVDNGPLKDELVARSPLPALVEPRLHVVHTPVEPLPIDHSLMFEGRRQARKPLRAFWAGRFDRQKRFDIVVAIAQLMPELEIWAWGKVVLGGSDADLEHLPRNIALQGTYDAFDDIPMGEFDFFLYTSEWDGLPTILIDVGIRGIPVVASRVGGVGDLISERTAYPVDDALNPNAYVAAIRAMVLDPAEVTRRARALKTWTAETCRSERYGEAVREVLGLSPAGLPDAASRVPVA